MNIENIKIILDDEEEPGIHNVNEENISKQLLDVLDFSDKDFDNHKNDLFFSQYLDYQMNYTVKQLLLICDYYEITKTFHLQKSNKDQIIHHLLAFENNDENYVIVTKRQNMWFYINELKNDKFMKKYILW